MNRRTFLRAAGAAAGAAAAAPFVGAVARGAEMKKRPNVLFLFTDDQRFDTVHTLGNDLVQTPNMDRLVERGIAFTHAHIMGGDQGAICICSRACLLTGRGLWRAPHEPGPDLALWTETMKRAGYTTFGTGKWHNGPATFARSFTAADQVFFGGMSNHLAVPVHAFDPTGRYPKSGAAPAEGFSSEVFSEAAIRFLRGYKEAAPFFAYVSYTAPHDPRMPPRKFADLYPPKAMPVPPNFMPRHPFDNGNLKGRDEELAPWPRTPEIVQEHLAAYYGMISHVDHEIGRVLAALQESGHADDTVIVFAGDNGLAVGQHGLFGKQNVYEHSVRVPLVLCAPGVGKPGGRAASLCYLHDIFPTVCDLAGVAIPETVESKSLVPLMRDPAATVYDDVYAAYRNVQRMVRTDRWKLIVYPNAGVTQLFDLQADPWELANLADKPEHASRLADMKKRLAAWQERSGDRLLTA